MINHPLPFVTVAELERLDVINEELDEATRRRQLAEFISDQRRQASREWFTAFKAALVHLGGRIELSANDLAAAAAVEGVTVEHVIATGTITVEVALTGQTPSQAIASLERRRRERKAEPAQAPAPEPYPPLTSDTSYLEGVRLLALAIQSFVRHHYNDAVRDRPHSFMVQTFIECLAVALAAEQHALPADQRVSPNDVCEEARLLLLPRLRDYVKMLGDAPEQATAPTPAADKPPVH